MLCLLFTCLAIRAQEFPDTIYTDKGMMIKCQVQRIEQHTVYYKPAVLDKKTRKGVIQKRNIASLALHSAVPVTGDLPMRHPYLGKQYQWIEDNGIIYADLHDGAPQLGQGLVTINTLLERNVRATSRDQQLFAGSPATMLLRLWIDEAGKLQNVKIEEYPTVNGVQGTLTRYIEGEILNVVSQMQPWRPATTNGANAPCMIYMPLKFQVGMNNIVMLPSKYAYSFKGRH